MTVHEIIGYPLFLIFALEAALGIILISNNQSKSTAQKVVAALSFFSAAFAFTSGAMYIRSGLGLPIDLSARLSWIGWFTVPAGLQVVFYMKDDRSRSGRLVGIILYPIWTLIFGLCLFTDLIVKPGYQAIPFVNHPGPLENSARLFGTLLVVWLLFDAVRLKQRLRGVRKAKLTYFFYGVLIFGSGAAFTAGVLQLFGGFGFEPGLAAFFSLPWVVLTYYAITRHRLFDLRLVVSRVLSILLLAGLLSITQILLFEFLKPALGNRLSIVISLAAIGLILSTTRISSRLHGLIGQLIVKDKYDYHRILKESIKAVITILDLEELLNFIIGVMKKSLGVGEVYLILKDRQGAFFRTDTHEALQESELRALAAIGTRLHSALSVVRDEFEEMMSTDSTEPSAGGIMKFLGAELIVPLSYKGEVQGVMVLGEKGNKDPYFQTDIELLESLAGHAAIAIENARLYEEAMRAKGSMRESEEKFRTLAETAAMAIFIHQGGNFLYANPAAEAIGGYTVSEYLTMNFMSLVHPDFSDIVRTRACQRLAGADGVPVQYEFRIIRKNGEERWVLMTAGISEFDGKSTVIGTLIDITKRKQAEEERENYHRQLQQALQSLRESEEKFRTLAETTTAAICIHQEQKLVYANKAAELMSGYSREELLREDCRMFHADYRLQAGEMENVQLRENRMPGEYEFKLVTKNGEERWAAATAGAIEYGGKPAIISTLFDITEWRKAEDAKTSFFEESVRQYEERIEEEKRHRREKEKILMDLHDGIGGITTNISILAELALKSRDRDHGARLLTTISQLSREGIAEIRCLMHGLDSKELSWRTLAAELRSQGTNLLKTHSIEFAIEAEVNSIVTEQPGSLTWVNIFKIYKEALTNVIKHSKATAVDVKFHVKPRGVLLSIQDNGTGGRDGNNTGRGLSHMKTRAKDIGGEVSIANKKGMFVLLELPLPLKYPA